MVITQRTDQAQAKIDAFKALKEELDADHKAITDKIDALKDKLKRHLYTEQNQGGLLTHNKDAYLQCLEFQSQSLQELYEADLVKWTQNLEQVKVQAAEDQAAIEELMQKQQQEL